MSKYFRPKIQNMGLKILQFRENVRAKLKFWAPVSLLSEICRFFKPRRRCLAYNNRNASHRRVPSGRLPPQAAWPPSRDCSLRRTSPTDRNRRPPALKPQQTTCQSINQSINQPSLFYIISRHYRRNATVMPYYYYIPLSALRAFSGIDALYNSRFTFLLTYLFTYYNYYYYITVWYRQYYHLTI